MRIFCVHVLINIYKIQKGVKHAELFEQFISVHAGYYSVKSTFRYCSTLHTANKTKKIDKKKLACSVAAAIGIAAGAAFLIAKKGDSKAVQKFFDNEGNLVKNVKLEKGKAIIDDGSLFAGTIKTLNKHGEAALEYADGNITKSVINGSTYKTFEKIPGKTRSEGVSIINKRGQRTNFLYDDKGKISTMYWDSKNGTKLTKKVQL